MGLAVDIPTAPPGPARGATAAERVASSAIRDLLRVAERPDVLSLAGGLPDVGLLDPARFRAASEAATSVAGANGLVALQYGPTAGLAPLREVVAGRLGVDADEVVITTGSQQALDLVARALCAPGDVVVVQEPAYLGAVQAFRAAGATVVGVGGDDEGIDVDAVADLLHSGADVRALYVVPDHHNPTGAVLSPGRRHRLRALAAAYGVVLVEDAAYRDLHWGPPTRTLHRPGAVDGAAPGRRTAEASTRVVHVGSSSKVLAPGLRVGWLTGPADVLDAVVRLKQAADLHTPTWNQLVVAHLLADDEHPHHLERLRREYRRRSHALHRALSGRLGDRVRIDRSDGGMFLWMAALDGTDTDALLERAIAAGVAFVPGSAFAVPGPGRAGPAGPDSDSTARLSFATLPEARLEEAAARLASVWSG
ncbi:aminotransferase-like domain-containing protein [Dermatobacter hominis]|uniref:aminotransferase-like domain-containing protein n=1 Tax=Dermatobacter hominis TaxID=2884263 RepID=UPI001D102555|nr:PLP-dependent aminotransferase family protein [Dermatobacter hominis]UDY34708.1 PLP-dependent aminotransferase family protein [Dermatobacter hominis]